MRLIFIISWNVYNSIETPSGAIIKNSGCSGTWLMSAISQAGASGSNEAATAGSHGGHDLTDTQFTKYPWSETSAGNARHQLSSLSDFQLR